MTAPDSIRELVEKFDQHRAEYRQHKNETELRREFLDPFFEALGWDMFNRKSASERYKEVVHEASVEVEGQAKAADYAFRVGDKNIFFVEAKKPSVNIETNPEPAFQLRSYGWSAKLALSLLTDFEQLAVYEVRARPYISDRASVGRVKLYHYSEYVEKWDEIAGLFSREAVLQGAFDRFAEGTKGRKGTAEVDDAFLAEIERWRDLLARNLALRNPPPAIRSERDLNFAVQMTIDRIIFLRICEDRGIEPGEQLLDISKRPNVYAELLALFRRADTKYNSGLFHFASDTLTPGLTVDDKVLKDILRGLYYPASPYKFNYISADILGQVYEQFLGKVIRLTAGHQAKVEEKPEVRKAGGVYYTPTYIVDYIVKNTVGKLLDPNPTPGPSPDGKPPSGEGGSMTPKEAAKLRILDPACGSGSFLLGAYQYLLDWRLKWYSEHEPEKWAAGRNPVIYQAGRGEWRLTAAEKKRILLDNIFGVDIDPQAVEVTKLSLLLKVLEGESGQLSLGMERLLPDLGSNIQCGNSLIGPDYYEGRQLAMFDEAEQYRVNAFDWQRAFPQVFDPHRPAATSPKSDALQSDLGEAGRGFDAVIGNPPYIRIQSLQEWAPTEVEFYKKKYLAARKGNYDIYVVFVERGLSLLNNSGRLGFILPHKFFNAQYGEPLRGIISKGKHLAKVVHFGDQQVFENATTYTCLIFLDKAGHDEFEFEKVNNLEKWRSNSESIIGKIPVANMVTTEWNFAVGEKASLFDKLVQMPIKLENVTLRIFQGIKTSADKIYILEEVEREKDRVRVFSKEKGAEYWLEPGLLHPLVKGGDSKRYKLSRTNRLLLFPYAYQGEKISLIPEATLKNAFPKTWEYLIANKAYLEDREKGKMKGNRWYAYIYPKNFDVIVLPKIFTPDIAAQSSFSLDETGEFYFTGGAAGGYGILVAPEYSRPYILGLLNSRLLEWFLHQVATTMRGSWYSYESRFIRGLPIRTIDFTNPAEKAAHERMVSLAEQMLELHRRLASARTPQEKEVLQRQVAATDGQIDRLVYQLYGLSEEEIRIVEGSQDA